MLPSDHGVAAFCYCFLASFLTFLPSPVVTPNDKEDFETHVTFVKHGLQIAYRFFDDNKALAKLVDAKEQISEEEAIQAIEEIKAAFPKLSEIYDAWQPLSIQFMMRLSKALCAHSQEFRVSFDHLDAFFAWALYLTSGDGAMDLPETVWAGCIPLAHHNAKNQLAKLVSLSDTTDTPSSQAQLLCRTAHGLREISNMASTPFDQVKPEFPKDIHAAAVNNAATPEPFGRTMMQGYIALIRDGMVPKLQQMVEDLEQAVAKIDLAPKHSGGGESVVANTGGEPKSE